MTTTWGVKKDLNNPCDCEILNSLINNLINSTNNIDIQNLRTKIREYLLGCVHLHRIKGSGIPLDDSTQFDCDPYKITVHVQTGGMSIADIDIFSSTKSVKILKTITRDYPNGIIKS